MGDVVLSLEGLSVMIAMPSHRDLSPWTNVSLMGIWYACTARKIPLTFEVPFGNAYAEVARNLVSHTFLQSKFNRLFWIDSDMQCESDDFLRVLAMSTEHEVVGCTYPQRSDPITFVLMGMNAGYESDRFGCITSPDIGFGLGFTVVQRKVMEALAAKAPKTLQANGKVVAEIFYNKSIETEAARKAGADKEFHGEDMNFFTDIQALGYKVWLDPAPALGHVGPKVFKASFGDLLAAKQQAAA